ncbi:gliding motility-associated peptidyl-prolyl isomerase GldI [Nonlabens spongiae]|uniref:Peptidyl-prolyl cis-trans isomerase n=1 Tax=Nonlabens spongiae TaxID=331648 RepID=A0A1W6MGY1_9FLAO|nr:gliding motility-associated peptidyl-prolyl isomerase GldI [Nonlabens spongiae]ARN76837.1 gliding motility-associated peptidyl-prolyl isomerase GldI [Nonlabens spongiae]
MKKNFWRLISSLGMVLALTISSCQKIEARRPVTRGSTSNDQASVEFNKKLNATQEAAIETLLERDSIDYLRSGDGFYYYFTKQDELETPSPEFGDRVTFEYDVVALNGDTIYRKEELSPVTKSMEQEYGIFKGMREALKLMQDGDEIIAYFPSYSAYGYIGDKNRIGANTPFKSRIKLLEINKSGGNKP